MLNFPKKSENGLIFPKTSENGLIFPKKSECAENNLLVPAKCFTDVAKETFAKCFPHGCLNACTDFDETFQILILIMLPIINRHGRTHEKLSQNEEVVVWNTDIKINCTLLTDKENQ